MELSRQESPASESGMNPSAPGVTSEVHVINIPPGGDLPPGGENEEDNYSLWRKYAQDFKSFLTRVGRAASDMITVINRPIYILGILFTAKRFSNLSAAIGSIFLTIPSISNNVEKKVRGIMEELILIKETIRATEDRIGGIAFQISKSLNTIGTTLDTVKNQLPNLQEQVVSSDTRRKADYEAIHEELKNIKRIIDADLNKRDQDLKQIMDKASKLNSMGITSTARVVSKIQRKDTFYVKKMLEKISSEQKRLSQTVGKKGTSIARHP